LALFKSQFLFLEKLVRVPTSVVKPYNFFATTPPDKIFDAAPVAPD
jgi:hypothetical protein